MSTLESFISALMQILKVLSAPAKEQVKYLQLIGGASVDELALEFEEVWLLAPSILESKEITECQYDALKKLNGKLDQLSEVGNDKTWTESALFKNGEWEEVRSLAKKCIESFPDGELFQTGP